MKVLITGAFGNVGTSTIGEMLQKGHEVRCFDLDTRANRRKARRWHDEVEVMWGDLRRLDDVHRAVEGVDTVIHLGFIIPKLSSTGIESEKEPSLAREVNVGGTLNLIKAMRLVSPSPSLIFVSSYHVYGLTQDQTPPRRASDPVNPIEHYARHKVECENHVRESGLQWTIMRLAATLPLDLKLDEGMFDVPPKNRMEFVHTKDVGKALANAVASDAVWGKVLLIGGGPKCQYYYGEIQGRIFASLGIDMLPERAFANDAFATDWLDTEESQRLLQYQERDLGDYIADMKKTLGCRVGLIRMFAPLVRRWLLRQSPYAAS